MSQTARELQCGGDSHELADEHGQRPIARAPIAPGELVTVVGLHHVAVAVDDHDLLNGTDLPVRNHDAQVTQPS